MMIVLIRLLMMVMVVVMTMVVVMVMMDEAADEGFFWRMGLESNIHCIIAIDFPMEGKTNFHTQSHTLVHCLSIFSGTNFSTKYNKAFHLVKMFAPAPSPRPTTLETYLWIKFKIQINLLLAKYDYPISWPNMIMNIIVNQNQKQSPAGQTLKTLTFWLWSGRGQWPTRVQSVSWWDKTMSIYINESISNTWVMVEENNVNDELFSNTWAMVG